MREQYLCDKHMYDFSNGCYCGVVVPENVMKELVKINIEYSNEVKKVLNKHKDKLYVSDWTLANEMENEKIKRQVIIKYTDISPNCWDGIEERIKRFSFAKPEYIKDFYIVNSRNQAEEIAEEILQEEIEKEKLNEL